MSAITPFLAYSHDAEQAAELGFSFFVECADQTEVDTLWEALTANGGEAGQCGWLKDPWGISWQIIPKRFTELMSDPDREKAQRTMDAMLKMKKLVVEELEAAARSNNQV